MKIVTVLSQTARNLHSLLPLTVSKVYEMCYWRLMFFCVCLLPNQVAISADGSLQHTKASSAQSKQIRRNYRDTSQYLVSSHAVVLQGSYSQIMRLSRWLDEIIKVPHGRKTLEAIFDSGNQLTIRHSSWALEASGRTVGPATDKLLNGYGEDVVILFDARIPEQGSHWVFDAQKQRIEFTAVQNLFHELAHARHFTNGTWEYADSEGQAIEEENIFRAQLGTKSGMERVPLRAGIDGVRFWSPEGQLAAVD